MKSQRSCSQSSPRWGACGRREKMHEQRVQRMPFGAHLVEITESRTPVGAHHQRSEFDNLGLLRRREGLDWTHIMMEEHEARQNFGGDHFGKAFLSLTNFGRQKNFKLGCHIKF